MARLACKVVYLHEIRPSSIPLSPVMGRIKRNAFVHPLMLLLSENILYVLLTLSRFTYMCARTVGADEDGHEG